MWESKYFNMEAENMFCQLLPCQKQNFLVTQGTYLLIVDHLVVVYAIAGLAGTLVADVIFLLMTMRVVIDGFVISGTGK